MKASEKFVSPLSSDQILQHVEQSHDLWGQKMSIPERHALQLERIEFAGSDSFYMSALVDEKDKLLSSSKSYIFRLNVDHLSYPCLGIGALFTSLDNRKSGYATELIKRVCDYAKERFQCEFALLYSDIGVSYYNRLGFVPLDAINWKITFTQSQADTGGFSLREVKEADFPFLLQTFKDFSSKASLYYERDEKIWKLLRAINGIKNNFIIQKENSEIGFLSCCEGSSYLWIDEMIVGKEYENQIWTFLRHFAERKNFREIRGWKSGLLPQGAEFFPREKAVPMIKKLGGLESGVKLSSTILAGSYLAPSDHF